MKCPTCGSATNVLETRMRQSGTVRKRQCENKCPRFLTIETYHKRRHGVTPDSKEAENGKQF